jgi:hypothetical protein
MAKSLGEGFLEGVRGGLTPLANATRAAQQQRYMKSAMPYYGVTNPEVRRVTR